MKTRDHGLSEKEMELVKLIMAECESTGDIQAKLKRLFAGTIEQMLEAEMDEHLGYEKHSAAGNNSGNSRNGYGKKTISSDYGECEIAVPRDRNGEFEPKIIEKRQTHTDEIEQKIMAMYAKGMSQRDIEDTLKEIYGAEISQGLVSRITDKILPEVNEWQNRPLDSIYPVVFFDGIVFNSRKDNKIINKCVYSVLGINMEGQKEILGTWISEANKKKEEKMKELQDFIARFSANASKSKQATSRKKALDKIQLDELKPSSRKYPYINFKPNREIGNDALVVENLTKTIDGVKVLDNISFLMKPTDKIAFVGPNTLAATTLFKILSGEMEPDSGSYKWGVTTTQSYFPKDNTKDFSQDETIVEWLTQYSEDKDATFVRGFLGRMLFSGEDALKKVGVLSGGEKVRCMLSKLMISGANILLLDEPTNHLDMESITALNEALKDFTGALLFTSQDHQFVQTTANRIMEITPNGLIDKECTYDEYLENDEAARKRQIVEIEEEDE